MPRGGNLLIALDGAHMRQSRAGIARYARGLADGLRRLPGFSVIELGGGPVVRRGTIQKRLLTLRQDLLWYPWRARRAAAQSGATVYHSPLLRGPLRHGNPPFVMTVHDLVPVRWPQTMPGWHRIYTRRVMARVVDSADRIIAVSADTANDLNVLLRVRPDRIRVVHNGVDAMFFGDAPSTRINERYVLFVGTPEPRKNLKRLAEAVGLLRSRGDRLSLVVAGAGGWGEGLAQGEGIEHVGRVSDSELHGLYANAACLAIPSLHEGFGLPALEAMAAGTPVVAADVGALPEVTGGAAILVDPENSTAIADGIERAISDRGRLVALGRAQARRFTWEITAALTAAVYREIA